MPLSTRCDHCPNRATRYYDGEHLCEIHYVAAKPNANPLVNPEEIPECPRCEHKALGPNGRKPMLVDSNQSDEKICRSCDAELKFGA